MNTSRRSELEFGDFIVMVLAAVVVVPALLATAVPKARAGLVQWLLEHHVAVPAGQAWAGLHLGGVGLDARRAFAALCLLICAAALVRASVTARRRQEADR